MSPDESLASAEASVNDMLQGAWMARAIHVAVRLGVPDLLSGGPRDVPTLAAVTGAHEASLRRILRILDRAGVVEELDGKDAYGPTQRSDVLRDYPDGVVATDAAFQAAPIHWHAWEHLEHAVRTGKAAFDHANGASFWDITAADAQVRSLFVAAMDSVSQRESEVIPRLYDFSSATSIVDVGGGSGSLLASILTSCPAVRGQLLERAPTVEHARELLDRQGLLDRVTLTPGDFFDTIPSDADVYIVKHVLHDWNDADAVRILERISRAMDKQSRLLIIDNFLDKSSALSALFVDLLMLVLVGGIDRSEADFLALADRTGLVRTRSIPTNLGALRILELRRG